MDINPEWIGTIAAIFTTGGYVPQAFKAIRSKHTESISMGMYIIMTLGGIMWLAYGIMLESWPLILANTFTSILTSIILVMKIKHG